MSATHMIVMANEVVPGDRIYDAGHYTVAAKVPDAGWVPVVRVEQIDQSQVLIDLGYAAFTLHPFEAVAVKREAKGVQP